MAPKRSLRKGAAARHGGCRQHRYRGRRVELRGQNQEGLILERRTVLQVFGGFF